MLSSDEKTVLVVNDAPDQLDLVAYLLASSGHSVLTASNGREGFELALGRRPDLIISDISMPVVDGIEMCRMIRGHDELRTIPILLISAVRKDSESVVEGLKAGADDFLEAPFETAHLISKAAQLIERKHAEQALRKAEEKYRSIFENAVEGIFQTSPDGRFISANPAMARILGYDSPEDLIANLTDIATQYYVDPDCRADLQRLLDERGVVAGFECEVFRKDGSRIWVLENIRAIRDAAGALRCYEGSVEDVTERKRLEEQLRQSQKLEAVGQLAGGIAHDFNNLLTAILGYSDLALRKIAADDPLRRNLGEIKRAAERAASLTSQLLAFSRKQILQPKSISLNAVVSDMDRMLRRLIGEDIDLLTKTDPELGSVRADPGQIEQVVLNLAINARDAMRGGGKLTIETANVTLGEGYAQRHVGSAPGNFVMLAVSDTGEGMDAETLARIFEPFFTTKEVGKGTGLGLSTVYGIVKQSGGHIWVYSELGEGTTFKIYLPRTGEGKGAAGVESQGQNVGRGTETVLLSEDDEGLRRLAREVLEMGGYNVLEAANVRDALLACERHEGTIHLLLTDVVMPEMSGKELSERLGGMRPDMRVLFMSGYTNTGVVRGGMLTDDTNFIQKPFTPEALLQKVRQVLDS